MLPAAFGRQIHLLERELHVRLFVRSTRRVSLTDAGKLLLPHARKLVADAEALIRLMHAQAGEASSILRVGAIDSAAAGLMPRLIRDLRGGGEAVEIVLIEDKTARLLPQLLSGSIDIAFVRPPERYDARLHCLHLLDETPVLALPQDHVLAARTTVSVDMLRDMPMILPSRRTRPHSHGIAVTLFKRANVPLSIVQEAEEKHTILGLVAAGLGGAIVPRWTGLSGIGGVAFCEIEQAAPASVLPLAAMWVADWRNAQRDRLLAALTLHAGDYATSA